MTASKLDKAARDAAIAARYSAGGVTLAQVGLEFGVGIEGVRYALDRVAKKAELADERRRAIQTAASVEDLPIEVMDLPVRVKNCLLNSRCRTVGDAMQLTDDELCGPNFGKASLKAWKQCLDDLRASFAQARGTPMSDRDLADAEVELRAAAEAYAAAIRKFKAVKARQRQGDPEVQATADARGEASP